MKTARPSFVAATAALIVASSLFVSGLAARKDPPGGGSGGSDRLALGGTYDDNEAYRITSDGLGEYQDQVDKVQFGQTGSGSRFDTGTKRPLRVVSVDLSGIDFTGVSSELIPSDSPDPLITNVDARFLFNDNDGQGLVLRDLESGQSGTVGYHYDFYLDHPLLEKARINYGRANAADRSEPDDSAIVVTRIDETTWTYAGQRGSLEVNFKNSLDEQNPDYQLTGDGMVRVLHEVEMPFLMTVRILP